jgi:heme-degrading monooxygenase HmoA
MAFIYQVSFDIKPEQMNELEIGSSLERTLGYLKTLLPSEPGFLTARGMYSLDIEGRTHLVFQTVWDTWEDLSAHQNSSLAEDKVLREFQPHVELQHLTVHKYGEVA